MSDWRYVALGELVDIYDHKRVPLSSTQRTARKGPYPYYGAQGIIDHIDDYIFDGRFILIPEDGENLRSRKLPVAYFAQGKFWVNNHAHIVLAKEGLANNRFLQSAIEATDIGPFVTGAAQPKLSQANLKQIQIKCPDLPAQEAIATILDALDSLIENNRRRIEPLEQMSQAIYLEWFVRFRYPGHENAPLVDSRLGPVPDGWQVQSLGEVVSIDRAGVQPQQAPDEVFDHYSIPAFDAGRLPALDPGSTIRSGKFLVNDPAVLVSKLNPRIERTWLVEPTDMRRSVESTEFLVLRPRAGLTLEFMYLQMRSAPFQERLRELSGGTSTSHQRAKPGDFLRIDVLVPPAPLCANLRAGTASLLAMTRNLRIRQRQVAAIRDLLLPKLVTGQIDVSGLDLDAVVESVA